MATAKHKPAFPAAKIKKLMQWDDDVGRIATGVPPLISKCLELFLGELVDKAAEVANGQDAKTLSAAHISQCIEEKGELAFLQNTLRTFNSGGRAPPPTRKRAGAGGAAAGKRGKPAAPTGLAGASTAGLDVTAAGATLPAMVGADRALEQCDDDYDE